MESTSSQLQALNNHAEKLGLTVHTSYPIRRKSKFFVCKGLISVSGEWEYEKIQHFLLGYDKAINGNISFVVTGEQIELLKKAIQIAHDAQIQVMQTNRHLLDESSLNAICLSAKAFNELNEIFE